MVQEAYTIGRLYFHLRTLVDHVTDRHPLGAALPSEVMLAQSALLEVEAETPGLRRTFGLIASGSDSDTQNGKGSI